MKRRNILKWPKIFYEVDFQSKINKFCGYKINIIFLKFTFRPLDTFYSWCYIFDEKVNLHFLIGLVLLPWKGSYHKVPLSNEQNKRNDHLIPNIIPLPQEEKQKCNYIYFYRQRGIGYKSTSHQFFLIKSRSRITDKAEGHLYFVFWEGHKCPGTS